MKIVVEFKISWNNGIEVFMIHFGDIKQSFNHWNHSDKTDKDWGVSMPLLTITRYTLPF